MSQFNLTAYTDSLLRNMKTLVEEIDVLKKDNEFLTKENRMLKQALGYEQRQNQKQIHERDTNILR